MKSSRQAILCVLALGAPLGAYQFLPVLNLTLPEIAVILLAPLVLADALRRKPAIPFELWWPCVLIALIAILPGQLPWTAALWPAAFAVIYLALGARQTLEHCLMLVITGGGIGALLSLAAQAGWVYPTDATVSGMPAGGLYGDVRTELVQFVALAPLALALCLHTAQPTKTRIAAGLSAAIMILAATLIGLRLVQAGLPREIQSVGMIGTPEAVALALVFWVICRTLAKLVMARHRNSDPVATPLFIGGAMASVCAVFFLPEPALVLVFLAALGARFAAPADEDACGGLHPAWIAPVLLLLALNLLLLPLSNTRDPRNYEAMAEELATAGDDQALAQRLGALSRSFEEARIDLWRARLALSRGDMEAAADAFVQAAQRPEFQAPTSFRPGRLAAPDAPAYSAFLDRFRDRISGLPDAERGLSYERALVAAGETENALASLRFRASSGAAAPVDPERAAEEIAAGLGDPALAETLSTWPAKELAAIHAKIRDVEKRAQ